MTNLIRSIALQERSEVLVDADGRVTFPLSSEEPYRRYDGIEVLDHTPKAVDLSFLASGNAPLLDTHDRYTGLAAQLGIVEDAWLEGKRVYVTVRFGNSARAQEVRKDVEAGIIRNVSVGYQVIDTTPVDTKTGVYHVTKWRLYEASFVPLPADATVGIGRSGQTMESAMTDKTTAAPAAINGGAAPVAPAAPADNTEARLADFSSAVTEITTIATAHGRADFANDYIRGEVRAGRTPSLAMFKGMLALELPDGKPLVNTDIGLTNSEKRNFSVLRLAAAMTEGAKQVEREAAAFELEVVGATSKQSRNGGHVLPTDILASWSDFNMNGYNSRSVHGRRAIEQTRAAMATSGNANVLTTAHLSGSFIDNLRDALVIGRLGVTMLPGLTDIIEVPGKDANISAAWLASEDANAAESNPSFRKITMGPKDVAAYTDITRRMLQQATIGIESLVRQDILSAMAEKIDLAAFYGSGAAGQPRGLKNTSGIGLVEFTDAVPTRDELIDMRKAIRATNQFGTASMVFDTDMEADLMKAPVDAGSGIFLANGSGLLQTRDQYVMTNALTSGDIFAGVFSDLLLGMWGGLELDRSTEAKFLSGGLRLRGIQTVDYGVRRVGSFVYGVEAA